MSYSWRENPSRPEVISLEGKVVKTGANNKRIHWKPSNTSLIIYSSTHYLKSLYVLSPQLSLGGPGRSNVKLVHVKTAMVPKGDKVEGDAESVKNSCVYEAKPVWVAHVGLLVPSILPCPPWPKVVWNLWKILNLHFADFFELFWECLGGLASMLYSQTRVTLFNVIPILNKYIYI